MAKGKNSFVLYKDQKGLFNYLSDEQAGKLIKTIFSYISDENPTPSDPIVNIAFESIKSRLKDDLVKWEETREKRSEAGKKGNEARWGNKSQES